MLHMSLGFEIKKTAQDAIPEQDESWDCKDEMVKVVRRKYKACSHARAVLLESRSEIAEATADKVWGTGLDVNRMLECLPDFWPGQNLMGHILKDLRTEFLEQQHLQQIEAEKKRKNVSPLQNLFKCSK